MSIRTVAKNWWMLALRGALVLIFGITFGILGFLNPTALFSVLVIVYGAFALVNGVFALAAVTLGQVPGPRWWAVVLEGVCGILIGLIIFFWLPAAELAIILLIAAWSIVTGIFEIVAAFQLRQEIQGEFWLFLSGVLSVLFGLLVMVFPMIGGIVIALFIAFSVAIFSIVFGSLMLSLAFRLRRWHQESTPPL
ncbi:MAG: HdeD family acid-resistance protein [Gemmataceae bacterium]